MDLGNLKPQNSFINLRHPGTDEELGLVFEMRPRYSDEVQAVNDKFEAQFDKKRGKKPSRAEMRRHSVSIILASVCGWEWQDDELTFNGEQPEYSRDTLKAWLKEYPWMLEFFSTEFADDSNFFTD